MKLIQLTQLTQFTHLVHLIILVLLVLSLSSCACQSDYFHPCNHNNSTEEMCYKQKDCRRCIKSGKNAEYCWKETVVNDVITIKR